MRRFLLALLVLFVVGGFVAWKNIGSAPSVLVDPATVPAGAGGQEIALEEPLAEGPQSLSEVRALLGPDAFAAAERQLRSYLADHPESGAAPVLLAEALRRQGKLEEASWKRPCPWPS
ncbi:MAG TPA: hypothetical protein PLJ12_13355 [Planctomycetota bacterium]|nr:hypothetical protein [Planctomycetota bacterium]